MAHPLGTKNKMRTPEDKATIVEEYLNSKIGQHGIAEKYSVSRSLFQKWVQKYEKHGIEGLKSKTGKKVHLNVGKYNRHPSEVEKLKLELLKKDIEVARLKKGYQVKGVGVLKEYVTIFDVNTK